MVIVHNKIRLAALAAVRSNDRRNSLENCKDFKSVNQDMVIESLLRIRELLKFNLRC